MEKDVRKAEQQAIALGPLEEKQAMLAAIIASSDDTIISKTLDGIITSWNHAAERLFGYSEAEALGKHITMIIPSDRLDEETFIISQVKKGERVDHFQTIRQAKDGSAVHISLTVSPIMDSAGKIIGASKIARDISGQLRAVEKQAILAAIVDTSDDTILSKTLEGVITSWNRAAEKMFGYSEQEALGQHISLIIPQERLSEESYIIGEIRKGNKVDHFETFRRRKDGRLIPISLSVSPVIDDTGKVIGASKIARDISSQLAAKQETERLYGQLKELNSKKDEFIALASHELKTPLTSVNGYLQVLARRVTEEKNAMFVQKVQHQISKLTMLVDDLLDVSKIEAGKMRLADEQFDISKLVAEAVELISHSNAGYDVTFAGTAYNCMVNGDPHRIEQVLINFLTNAIRYAPESRLIEVLLEDLGQEVKVGVRDFGQGIEADKLEKIFSRYYRVEAAGQKASGLGIGLYLCDEIISRHKGRIWAESKIGQGSTFWFTLPR